MKYFTSLFALVVCSLGFAQVPVGDDGLATQAPAATAAAPCCDKEGGLKIDLTTTAALYDFEDGAITQVDAAVLFTASKHLKFGVGMSFFNDDNSFFDPYELTWQLNKGINGRSGTGIGDLDLFSVVNLFDGKCEYIKADHVWFDINGGVKVPFDGTYASGDAVPHVGAEVGSEWGKLSLSYGFSYQFVDDYTFVAPLGGFVNDDVYTGIAKAGWEVSDEFSLCFKASQYLSGGKELLLVGPGFEYAFAKNIDFNADIGIPVDGDTTAGGELDIAFSAGLGFKF